MRVTKTPFRLNAGINCNLTSFLHFFIFILFVQNFSRVPFQMQLRHDGKIGFPGGYVDDGETLESALRRELLEELGPGAASDRLAISETNYVVTHVHPDQRLCLHFYLKKIDHDVFINIEKRVHEGALYGLEVTFSC